MVMRVMGNWLWAQMKLRSLSVAHLLLCSPVSRGLRNIYLSVVWGTLLGTENGGFIGVFFCILLEYSLLDGGILSVLLPHVFAVPALHNPSVDTL